MLFFPGCATTSPAPDPPQAVYDAAVLPAEPEMLPVDFVLVTVDGTQGLMLTLQDYRNLETNILRMRRYQQDLLDLLLLYRPEEEEETDG